MLTKMHQLRLSTNSYVKANNQMHKNFNKITMLLVCAYIFACAIPHSPAARYALLGCLLILGIVGLLQKKLEWRASHHVIVGLTIFVVIALISSITSSYVFESLNAFRKDYIPPLLVLFIGSSLNQTCEEKYQFAKYVVCALVAGFGLKTGLAFWDGAINNPFIFDPYFNEEFVKQNNGLPKYVSFYAVEAVLYITITFAALLCFSKQRMLTIILSIICLLSVFMIFVSGIRTAVVTTVLAIFITLLLNLKKKKIVLVFAILGFIVIGVGGFLIKNNLAVDRYLSLIKTESYVKQDSDKSALAGRLYIWEGMIEIIQNRPFFGFGPGWQKIPEVAKDTGLLEKWKNAPQTYNNRYKAGYFSLERGQMSPHNLIFQILFETGWLGLIAYVVLFATFVVEALRTPRCSQAAYPLVSWLKITVVSYCIAYILMDITNALLLHNTLIALALVTILINDSLKNKRLEGCVLD